ncbi:MAG: tetratricopeptide repeat protein [Planctomycetaceae bacterium]
MIGALGIGVELFRVKSSDRLHIGRLACHDEDIIHPRFMKAGGMWLLAQGPEGGEALPIEFTWVDYVVSLLGSVSSLAYFAFLIWMVVYCVRRDPDQGRWLWILLIFQPFGPFIYFFARYLPSASFRLPGFLKRWSRGGEIRRLEIAAAQIGNPHQYIQLGEALLDVGRNQDASKAFQKALDKEKDNLPALWGRAQADFQLKEFSDAKEALQQALAIDPKYKFGDTSLLLAKSLNALEEFDEARTHLVGHVRQWRQPEGLYLLATLEEKAGNDEEARQHLEALLMELEASPPAIARKHLFWRGRAKRLLRRVK